MIYSLRSFLGESKLQEKKVLGDDTSVIYTTYKQGKRVIKSVALFCYKGQRRLEEVSYPLTNGKVFKVEYYVFVNGKRVLASEDFPKPKGRPRKETRKEVVAYA